MSPVVIILIILGIGFIFVSYVFSEKLEQSVKEDKDVIEIPDELTELQKEKIKKLIDDFMDESVDGKMNDIESRLSEIVNQKTLALGDYAVTVNEEIERNHSEVMFLYNMLADKQKEVMSTATQVDEYRKDIEAYVNANHINMKPVDEDKQELEEAIKEIDENLAVEEQTEEQTELVDSSKDIILEMHKSGLSILEIAKHLGLGVGEVKLVVDLYQGEAK